MAAGSATASDSSLENEPVYWVPQFESLPPRPSSAPVLPCRLFPNSLQSVPSIISRVAAAAGPAQSAVLAHGINAENKVRGIVLDEEAKKLERLFRTTYHTIMNATVGFTGMSDEYVIGTQLTAKEKEIAEQWKLRSDHHTPWRILCLTAMQKSVRDITPTDKWALLVLRVHAAQQESREWSNIPGLLRHVPSAVLLKLHASANTEAVGLQHRSTAPEIRSDDLFQWLNHPVLLQSLQNAPWNEHCAGKHEFKGEEHWNPVKSRLWSKQQLCAIFLALRRLCILMIEVPNGDNRRCTIQLPWCAGLTVHVPLLRFARALVECHDTRRAKLESKTCFGQIELPDVLVEIIWDYMDGQRIVWNPSEEKGYSRYGRHYINYTDVVDMVTLTPLQIEQLFAILRQDKKEFVRWKSFSDLPPCLIQYSVFV